MQCTHISFVIEHKQSAPQPLRTVNHITTVVLEFSHFAHPPHVAHLSRCRQTKEEKLYGVFAEDFDDHGYGGGGGGGGRGRQQKAASTKRGGMLFVKQGGSGAWGTSG